MMKTQSMLQKGARAAVQSVLRKKAGNSPCETFWNYQPHRPEKPLPQPQDKQ